MTKERSPQTPALTVLSHSTLVDSLYAHLSVADVLNLQKVSWQICEAVRAWIPSAYNVENHFRRFFDDPKAFRVLQAQTGTIVSGSNALQFFERSYYPDGDLDLYSPCRHSHTVVRWLEAHNYVFQPTPKQTLAIAAAAGVVDEMFAAVARRRTSAKHGDPTDEQDGYVWSAVEDVYTFLHGEKTGLKVQVIVVDPVCTPVACVLDFHTTIVMNFIAWDRAYSLFPCMKFLTRTCITFGDIRKNPALVPIYAKYWRRGFKISTMPMVVEIPIPGVYFGERWTNDRHSWMVQLPSGDIQRIVEIANVAGLAGVSSTDVEDRMDIEETTVAAPTRSTVQLTAEAAVGGRDWVVCREIETTAGFSVSYAPAFEKEVSQFEHNANLDRFTCRYGTPGIWFEQLRSPILRSASLLLPSATKNEKTMKKEENPMIKPLKEFLHAQAEFEKANVREVWKMQGTGGHIAPQDVEGWKYWDAEVWCMVQSMRHQLLERQRAGL